MDFSHRFDPTVLREYDIRGIVDNTLHTADAFAIGRCFGTMVSRAGGTTVAVGYDGRLSSPALEQALVEGLVASGMTVLRIGRGPTPMLYYAAATRQTGGAVMVTGSHNPPNYNGFKMMLGGKPFFGAQILALGEMAAAGDVVTQAAGKSRRKPREKSRRSTSRRNTSIACWLTTTARGRSRWCGTTATARRATCWRNWLPGCPARTRCCSPRSTGASPTTTRTRRCRPT